MNEKQKLTLSVNKEVVKKAKDMGLNISELTENILKGFTFEPEKYDDTTLYKQYRELFNLMHPLMDKHSFRVKIGEGNPFPRHGGLASKMEIHYHPDGSFWDTWNESEFYDIGLIEIHNFLSPSIIIENFIDELSKIAENRKQKSKELEMAKRIVEAISASFEEDEEG